ncbi:MAG: phosphoglycolate phosphatase [Thermoplasmata archaeon]
MNRILAVGCDYDRTLTDNFLEISKEGIKSLRLARKHGITTIVVSGRTTDFLTKLNRKYGIADILVAENGAVLFFQKGNKKILTSNIDLDLRTLLDNADFPIEFGEVIASTKVEYEKKLLKIIETKNINVKLIRNIDSMMLLPPDVDKGIGLLKALKILEINKRNLAVIGDGENDLEMFSVAGTRVAVANAVELLKRNADIICKNSYGAGVAEFIDMALKNKKVKA